MLRTAGLGAAGTGRRYVDWRRRSEPLAG